MKVSKLFSLQVYLYSGMLSLTIAGTVHAAPTAPAQKEQSSAAGQSSRGASKTYQSQLGFRFNFTAPYVVDKTQEGKGTIVLRDPSLNTQAVGSDQPAPVDSNVQSQSSPGDKITISRFDNPQRLSARQWAEQNKTLSFFDQQQSDYRSYNFAGKPAVSYSWCTTNTCGDSIIVPSRDGRTIFVLRALYDYPGDAVRWDFQRMAGRFQLTQ
ncbi:hypothetical protein [Leptolyngbya sp. FACHB-17]|uniref:hypothetical protein n=1 Tax=unclassified Leptolyngbya TaxID=2650499 RepID=UPI001680350C|nr:hypothetical protein [Leptolyngbya sp. FACHB-17]MBD2079524.1 hypothetical protein [Leptolyngbya sp. FACHB-17]